MKRILSALTCAALVALSLMSFAACDNKPSDEGVVNLVALGSGADVVARDDIDYFVVPEPAASARVKAAGFNFAGDLQQLYGGENGYPQAVIVAKNSLFESDALGHFVAAINENVEWLQAETTQISTVVEAVTGHLTEDLTPTFNANNLTKQVIANCGIRYSNAYDSKSETKSFLSALKEIQPNINDNPSDKFFWDGNVDTQISNLEEISVYAPDGAPALVLAGLMAGEISTASVAQNINYNIVNASTIQAFVTGSNPVADICVLPVNLASNLLGSAENYTMLGTVTHGNLFILSANSSEQITVYNLSELKGKTVGVVNLAAVPGLTFKLVLNKYGIQYSDPSAEL